MDRRGFLQAFLGVAAGAALPQKALSFLAETAHLNDANFIGGVDLNFTSADLAISIEDFAARFLQPAMIALSKAIDDDCMKALK